MEWDEWEKFDNLMKRRHPVQFRLRELGMWISFRADDAMKFFPSWFRYLFRPCHPIIRNSIPRTWCDLDALMVDINFAIILQFHDEMQGSCVDWDWDEQYRNFKAWIESAVKWINETRPNLIKQDDAGMPAKVSMSSVRDPEFQSWSEKHHQTEKEIDETDSKILKEMIENRRYFWT